MVRSLSALLVLAGCSDSFDNDLNGPNGANSGGYDGAQSCWDLNWNGEADPDEDTNGDGTVDVYDCRGEAGSGSGADGQDCWDLDGDGIGDPEEDTNGDGVVDVYDCRDESGDDTGGGVAVQVVAGYYITCALLDTGTVDCWGMDVNGVGAWLESVEPSALVSRAVHSGVTREVAWCALFADSTAECRWATGESKVYADAVDVSLSSSSFGASCGLRGDGTVDCEPSDASGGPPPSFPLSSIVGNADNHCGLTGTGSLYCWGNDVRDSLDTPGGTYVDVRFGELWGCARTSSGDLDCWGFLDRTGSDGFEYTLDPGISGAATAVGVGAYHGCSVLADSTLECWGDGAYAVSLAPGGSGFVDVSVGRYHNCAIDVAGKIECWGGSGYQVDVPAYLRR